MGDDLGVIDYILAGAILVALAYGYLRWEAYKLARAEAEVQRRAAGSDILAAAGQLLLLAGPLRISHPEQGDVALGAATTASVDATGSMSVTRGRDLGAKGASWFVLGPIGPFVVGNAKETTHDHRELYLVVRQPDLVVPCDPALGAEARRFALAVEAGANDLRDGPEQPDLATSRSVSPPGWTGS
ncbi:MAG: hypothetical protein MSC31_10870 [Solirubrobacteraceae bacterium MAG38_C4-C5]|nr:hypothetical protein [Candidatus Siliceabacter maunaloa]